MTVPKIVLKTNATQYAKLVNLSNRVVSSLTGNLDFSTPAVPLAVLMTQTTAVTTAIATWGPKGSRGSHADLVNLRLQALTLWQLLKAEAAYVQTTATVANPTDYAAMAAMMTGSGFELKASKHHQGVLNAVQKLRFMKSDSLNRNQTKFAWETPLGVTSINNVKSYNVYRSLTTNFTDAVIIDTISKAEFIDTNVTGVNVTYTYFIIAVGAAGQGAVSSPLTITLLPA